MGGRDLDRSRSEFHIDGDGVSDDWDTTIGEEGVDGEFAVKVLVSEEGNKKHDD